MGLLEVYTDTVEFTTYEAIREALFKKDLSRSFDKRSYAEGNIRDGVVSIMHGRVHRNRRRIENTQFRAERLKLYEAELFPSILDKLLDDLIDRQQVDLFTLGEMVSVVLAAKRAGLDPDPDDLPQLRRLVAYVNVFSQGSAILDQEDPDTVREQVREALAQFEEEFVLSARQRREEALAQFERGEIPEDDLPYDILTIVLMNRDDPGLELNDAGRIVRETATYLQGGTHTSSQTLINALDLLFPAAKEDPTIWKRILEDRLFAQRCIHETLRLRPTTPRIKRRAETDTEIAGVAVPADAMVILDAAKGNREPELFGDDAESFNPDRTVAEGVPRWGLSFGAGAHACPGRSVAGGLPVPTDFEVNGDHLFGLVALMLQAVVQRGVEKDPDQQPVRDTRTERYTRWSRYPVRFRSREPSTL